MCKSKRMQSFKQSIKENNGKRIEQKKYININNKSNDKRFVIINVGEDIIKVDRGRYYVSPYEIKDIVRDIFEIGLELKEKSTVNLYNICDFCYNLMYEGRNSNEMLFKLC